MPALSFQRQFRAMILDGQKQQTTRETRKRPIKENDPLFLYIAQRTAQREFLGFSPCVKVQTIFLYRDANTAYPVVTVDGKILSKKDSTRLAWSDGFDDFDDFWRFFFPPDKPYRGSFRGQIIHWRYPFTSNNDPEVVA